MDLNPYTPGAGKVPAALAGRDRHLAQIDNLAAQFEGGRSEESIVFTGLRGMGKTVLVKQISERLAARGWLSGYFETRRDVGPGAAIEAVVAQGVILLPTTSRVRKALAKLIKAAASGTELTVTEPHTGMSVGLRLNLSGRSQDTYRVLLEFLKTLGEAALADGVGVAIVLDELQLMKKADMAVLLQTTRHPDVADRLPVALIAAGLPYLPGEMSKASTYSERLNWIAVDNLSRLAVIDAVRVPAEEYEVTWTDTALAKIVELSKGYPFFVQLYASETWDGAGRPSDRPGTIIDVDAVIDAVPRVQERLDQGLYAARYQRATQKQRAYLRAVASLGDGTVSVGEVAQILGEKLSALSPQRDQLIKNGLIHSPGYGQIEFSVPGFADYVRRVGALEIDDEL
jgi:hypothetical protein